MHSHAHSVVLALFPFHGRRRRHNLHGGRFNGVLEEHGLAGYAYGPSSIFHGAPSAPMMINDYLTNAGH